MQQLAAETLRMFCDRDLLLALERAVVKGAMHILQEPSGRQDQQLGHGKGIWPAKTRIHLSQKVLLANKLWKKLRKNRLTQADLENGHYHRGNGGGIIVTETARSRLFSSEIFFVMVLQHAMLLQRFYAEICKQRQCVHVTNTAGEKTGGIWVTLFFFLVTCTDILTNFSSRVQ